MTDFVTGTRLGAPVRTVARPSLSRVLARAGRLVGWVSVGFTGVFVNTAALWLFAGVLGLNYLVAACVATQVSSTWNFLLVDRIVYRGPKRSTPWRRWAGFMTFSNSALLVRIPLLGFLVGLLGIHYLLANAATLVLTFLARFAAQERLTMQEGETCPTPSTVT